MSLFPTLRPMTIICFSHLRWNFVYQRPQHLLTRFAKTHTIYYIEEPFFHEEDDKNIMTLAGGNIHIVTPHLNKHNTKDILLRQFELLKKVLHEEKITNYIFWYYSPMMFLFSKHFHPSLVIYDCMDEWENFPGIKPPLLEMERELVQRCDLFCSGILRWYRNRVSPRLSMINPEHR